MNKPIAFRKKIIIDVNRSVLAQVGKVQKGQWLWISGMNARVVNIVGGIILLLRFDRKTGQAQLLQYA